MTFGAGYHSKEIEDKYKKKHTWKEHGFDKFTKKDILTSIVLVLSGILVVITAIWLSVHFECLFYVIGGIAFMLLDGVFFAAYFDYEYKKPDFEWNRKHSFQI